MPTKEDTNVTDVTLYFEDENGERRPIWMFSKLSEVEITEVMMDDGGD